MIPLEKIEEGRALLAKATPGPWTNTAEGDANGALIVLLRNNADALLSAASEASRLEQENTRLRAALAQSDRPCVYCSLPADEWALCQSGFPGCDRADDAMGCPELGARMDAERLAQQVETIRAETVRKCADLAKTSKGYPSQISDKILALNKETGRG
jgi:hypothetical protein